MGASHSDGSLRTRRSGYDCDLTLSLANCCSAPNSLGFPVLLRFCDAQSGRSFIHPLHRYPGPLARTRRRPFPNCGVATPQAPTPDRESLPETIAQSTRVGPHLRWLDGDLSASKSSAPSAIVLKPSTLGLQKAMSKQKYHMLFSSDRRRKPGAKGPSTELIHAVVEMKQRNPNWGCPRIAESGLGVPHPHRQGTGFEGFSPITTGRGSPPVVPLG